MECVEKFVLTVLIALSCPLCLPLVIEGRDEEGL